MKIIRIEWKPPFMSEMVLVWLFFGSFIPFSISNFQALHENNCHLKANYISLQVQ